MHTPATASEAPVADAAPDALATAAVDYGDARPPVGWTRWRKRLKRAAAIVTVLAVVLVAACLWLRVYSSKDLEAYRVMWHEVHPVWHAFALRRYGLGDSAAAFVKDYPPVLQQRFGPYALYSYNTYGDFSGIAVVSENERLILADVRSCTFTKTFFERNRPALDAAFETYWHARRSGRLANWSAKRATVVGDAAARFAAMGAGVTEPEPVEPASSP